MRTTRVQGAVHAEPAEDDEILVDLDDGDRPTDPDSTARQRAMELLGQVISQRYRIDELVGLGGMGAVYRAYHLLLKKRVAIKVLLSDIKDQPELAARFAREAIAGAHISHPNVTAATDLGRLEDGSYFLVLEYVPGETLHALLHRERLSAVRAVHIARQIASALAAMHAIGIVHRDLKPSNVMLAEGRQDLAKVIDFGLAKVPMDRIVGSMPPAPRLTGVGVIFGTIAYLAPEAAEGMGGLDARADLYALGIILYQMLAGRRPFDAVEASALFAQHRFEAPPSLLTTSPAVPPALDAIVMRLLDKDPTRRYGTSLELIEALDALGLGTPEPHSGPGPVGAFSSLPDAMCLGCVEERPGARSVPRVRARPRLAPTLAFAAFALATAMCAYLWSDRLSWRAVSSPPQTPIT